ncbi:MAG: preprotein translocase subunit SecG [Rickettsiales bacterium]|nr:preprotein translocase subunit SecG [Rickettsiales bacterium]
MQTLLTIVQIIIGVLLVVVILLQSGSDELKGLGSSGVDNVMSPTASANFMTKFTAILAAIFIINCLVLANISSRSSKEDIADKISKIQTPKSAPDKVKETDKNKSLPIAS